MSFIDRLSHAARSEPAKAAVVTWRIIYLTRLRAISEVLATELEHRFMLGSYAMCDIATRLLENGLTEEARNSFEQAQVLMPRNVDCRIGLGRVALMENKLELAESYFRSALLIEDENPFALLGMGDVLLESKPEMAIDFFTRAIEISPLEPYGYYQRASAYEKLGKLTEARVDWDRVKRLESEEM